MSTNIRSLSRPKKQEIAATIIANLTARRDAGPAEAALDAYIDELAPVAAALGEHVDGKIEAAGTLAGLLDALDVADDEVDRRYRHTYRYLETESLRRRSPVSGSAANLLGKAFPDALGQIDDPPADENVYCREALAILGSAENAETLTAIELPTTWLASFGTALDQSEAAVARIVAARGDKGSHVTLGGDAEARWAAVMVRLRKYVGSRADRTNVAKTDEGKRLLAPLLDAVGELKRQAAARATRKAKPGTPPVA